MTLLSNMRDAYQAGFSRREPTPIRNFQLSVNGETVTAPIVTSLPQLSETGFNDSEENLLAVLTSEDSKSDSSSRLQGVVNGGLIHSTHLSEICPRQIALLRHTKAKILQHRVNTVDSNSRLIWATGRAFEEHIRNQFIAKFGKGGSVGKFSCRCGQTWFKANFTRTSVYDASKHDQVCGSCGTAPDIYHELPIKLFDFHSVYSPDYGYWNSQHQGVVVEIKSLKKESTGTSYIGFEDLAEPKIENLKQAYRYHLAAELSGAVMAPYVVVVYASKGWINPRESQPYKIYKVGIDEYPTIYDANRDVLEVGKVVKAIDTDGRVSSEFDSGDGFPSGVCSSITCPMAKQCQMASLCFSLRGH